MFYALSLTKSNIRSGVRSSIYNNVIYFFLVALSFLISYLFYQNQKVTLPYLNEMADSLNYLSLSDHPLATLKSGTKPFGYPVFLWCIKHLTVIKNSFNFPTLIVQFIIYASAVFFFSFLITKKNNLRLIITGSLLLNIFILPYLSVTSTETISLSLFLVCSGIFWGLPRTKLNSLMLGLIAAFTTQVHLGNLWFYALMIFLLSVECLGSKEIKKNLFNLILFLLGSLIVFFPQLYANYHLFNKLSFLPLGGIEKVQFKEGKQFTHVVYSFFPLRFSFFSKNPFLLNNGHSFEWISVDGFSFMLLKILTIFSHFNFYVYQEVNHNYQKGVIFLSSFTTYFGLIGLFAQRKYIEKSIQLGILVGLIFCTALYIFTAIEDRFTLVILLLLFPLAFYQIINSFKNREYVILSMFLAYFLFMNLYHSILYTWSVS